jgi:hypothetical protein
MACTDVLEALRALLGCVQADGAQVSDAILEEKNEAKLKRLTISELAPGMLLLATDEGRKRDKAPACMSPLFKDDGAYDQNRACDAVLLRKAEDGLHVCYIELKSDSPSGYEGQFASTHCFMRYVAALSEKLCNCPLRIVRERYVVFHTDSSGKRPRGKKQKMRFKPASANTPTSPDMFCVVDGDTVRWTEFFS